MDWGKLLSSRRVHRGRYPDNDSRRLAHRIRRRCRRNHFQCGFSAIVRAAEGSVRCARSA